MAAIITEQEFLSWKPVGHDIHPTPEIYLTLKDQFLDAAQCGMAVHAVDLGPNEGSLAWQRS